MACVRKRRGKWVLDFRDQEGNRRWETFRTRQEADDALSARLKQLRTGSYVPPREVPTFEEIAKDWLATKSDRRVSTVSQWEVHIDLHLNPALGKLRLDRIRVADFDRFKADRLAAGLKPQTVNKLLTTAAAIFQYANRCEVVEKNPAAVVERCRTNAGELTDLDADTDSMSGAAIDPDNVLSPEEAGKLIRAAEPGFYQTYLLAAVLTGARVGELTALRWSDVDLDGAELRIRRGITWARRRGSEGRGEARFYPPKTRSSRRSIDLAPELVAQLRRWKLACPPSDDGLVFPSDSGKPRHRSVIATKGLAPALAAADLKSVNLHSLRHTYASTLIMDGHNVTEVAAKLGHNSPDVTLRVYSHWWNGRSKTRAGAAVAARVFGETR